MVGRTSPRHCFLQGAGIGPEAQLEYSQSAAQMAHAPLASGALISRVEHDCRRQRLGRLDLHQIRVKS